MKFIYISGLFWNLCDKNDAPLSGKIVCRSAQEVRQKASAINSSTNEGFDMEIVGMSEFEQFLVQQEQEILGLSFECEIKE